MARIGGEPHGSDRPGPQPHCDPGFADSESRRAPAGFAKGKPGMLHPLRRLRAFMRSCSLKTAFAIYAIAATVVALAVSTGAASVLSNASSEIWRESSARSGMYIYVSDANALVPAEALSWYGNEDDSLYVEVPEDESALAIRIDEPGSDSESMRVYDGRILDGEDLAEGATDDPIPLAAVPAYDEAQKRRLPEGAADGSLLPADERGEKPASSVVSYCVAHHPEDGAYDALQLLTFLVFPGVFALVFVATAHLFYRNHLKQPIATMRGAAQRIAENDLDFELAPDSGNELGKLTESFETMRASLVTSNREMWRMVEARKEANAAFAHDLRTPLTVLRGQLEMLASYTASGSLAADQIEEMARSSQRQVERIERYIEAMRDLAKLDDCEVVAVDVDASLLVERLGEAARALAADCGKRSDVIASELPETARLDADVVERVAGNLLANAARYATSLVVLVCAADGSDLVVTVEDDGPGFSAEALEQGLEPYYRDTSRPDSSEHFGLGLGICSLLVAKCGGSVALSNRFDETGARVEARFPGVFNR